jgi:hypothetical protein
MALYDHSVLPEMIVLPCAGPIDRYLLLSTLHESQKALGRGYVPYRSIR